MPKIINKKYLLKSTNCIYLKILVFHFTPYFVPLMFNICLAETKMKHSKKAQSIYLRLYSENLFGYIVNSKNKLAQSNDLHKHNLL